MAVSTWGSITLRIRRPDREGRAPLPELVGSPVVRTPNLSGGSNVQVVGYLGEQWQPTLEFANIGEYNALKALVGQAATLTLRPSDTMLLVYTNMVLETITGLTIGRDRTYRATARFTRDA